MTLTHLFLILSIFVNVLFVFYLRWLVKILLTRDRDILFIKDKVEFYLAHARSVHEFEVFYGDETLASLLRHGTDLIEDISGMDLIEDEDEEIASTPQTEEAETNV